MSVVVRTGELHVVVHLFDQFIFNLRETIDALGVAGRGKKAAFTSHFYFYYLIYDAHCINLISL